MKEKTTPDLLRTLLEREGVTDAPTKTIRSGKWVEAIIAVGDDETCFLTMTQEAYEELFEYKVK